MSRLVGGKPIIEVDKEIGEIRPELTAARACRLRCAASHQFRHGVTDLGRGATSGEFEPLQNCLR